MDMHDMHALQVEGMFEMATEKLKANFTMLSCPSMYGGGGDELLAGRDHRDPRAPYSPHIRPLYVQSPSTLFITACPRSDP
jgi:hypothetical protein